MVDEYGGVRGDTLGDGERKNLFWRLVFYLCFHLRLVFVLEFVLLML